MLRTPRKAHALTSRALRAVACTGASHPMSRGVRCTITTGARSTSAQHRGHACAPAAEVIKALALRSETSSSSLSRMLLSRSRPARQCHDADEVIVTVARVKEATRQSGSRLLPSLSLRFCLPRKPHSGPRHAHGHRGAAPQLRQVSPRPTTHPRGRAA